MRGMRGLQSQRDGQVTARQYGIRVTLIFEVADHPKNQLWVPAQSWLFGLGATNVNCPRFGLFTSTVPMGPRGCATCPPKTAEARSQHPTGPEQRILSAPVTIAAGKSPQIGIKTNTA